MSVLISDQPSVCGVLPFTLTSLFDVGSAPVKYRVVAARFTNVSKIVSFIAIKFKNKENEVVSICPEGMNLDPGCTFELLDPGESIWLHKNEAIYGKTINDARVEYAIFFGS